MLEVVVVVMVVVVVAAMVAVMALSLSHPFVTGTEPSNIFL